LLSDDRKYQGKTPLPIAVAASNLFGPASSTADAARIIWETALARFKDLKRKNFRLPPKDSSYKPAVAPTSIGGSGSKEYRWQA
jgi:hypothetical protein